MINPNAAFEDELYFQYLKDPQSVSPAWREYFDKVNGKTVIPVSDRTNQDTYVASAVTPSSAAPLPTDENYNLKEDEEFIPFSNISSKIAENMQESLQVPTATSIRTIPVKAMDENRKIINHFLTKNRRNKVSFTHILLWAIVKGLQKYPQLNDTYTVKDGSPFRVKRKSINIGLAVDLVKKDGTRLLMVPNLKNSQQFHFSEFVEKFDDIVIRARNNKLTLDELQGTSATLTNPGMIGTSASVPRLMKGQGFIIAAGAIDYPVEFQSVRQEVLTTLAVSKVVTMTNTYDHRIIQGAESAEFLAYIHKLLIGENRFYDQIFASLRIPFEPVRWEPDVSVRKYGLDNTRTRVEKGAHVMQMINAYRVRGHLLSSTNPLGNDSYYYPELDPNYYGLTIWDLDREFPASSSWEKSSYPLREVIQKIRDTYCGTIGIEYMHIQDVTQKDYIKKWFETKVGDIELNKEDKLATLKKLIEAEQFEGFLHKKFIGHKRFSLEGSESFIVMLDKMFDLAADGDCDSVLVGMAHRGRLNVLVNNVGKSIVKIFNEFDGDIDTNYYHGSGDVKYHLGQGGQHISHNNKAVNVFLAPNPSHLEVVDPVVLGMARALKDEKDLDPDQVLPILVHGDAAFAGQGILQETLNLSQLSGYSTGGTIHIIINNQIGFTTTSEDSRSTTYASDVGKTIQCPILHVNGNDPEAIVEAASFAMDYRQKYNSDVIIDMLCYRKYGHNEGDEPSYTQPLLYKKIRSLRPVREVYENQLIEDGVITQEEAKSVMDEFLAKLNKAFDDRNVEKPDNTKVPDSKVGQTLVDHPTQVSQGNLDAIANAITTYPDNFNINPKVKAGLTQRRKMMDSVDTPKIDWALAEALAFGGLLLEGHSIRLSGEDSRRGTFSQRHAVLIDAINEHQYVPLNDINSNQGEINIFDSPLSELAVLGFDYGYSVRSSNSLTLWEAQFGDFANMAQPIVDQFISCGEVKWKQLSNIVMLLPHGHDGQGPEHSSARLERYLQLCADENMIVGNFTTPSNYFHALRRQMKLGHKTPLILMTPKSMLRHVGAVSGVTDFTNGKFQHIIDDPYVGDPNSIKRVVFCTGKLYYEILEGLQKSDRKDIAIVRIEQLYPLHQELLNQIMTKYQNATEILWAQEEPMNQGAWTFILPYLMGSAGGRMIHYCGRQAGASTATGSAKIHAHEQANIINSAINGEF